MRRIVRLAVVAVATGAAVLASASEARAQG
jgi:hypothetical protein